MTSRRIVGNVDLNSDKHRVCCPRFKQQLNWIDQWIMQTETSFVSAGDGRWIFNLRSSIILCSHSLTLPLYPLSYSFIIRQSPTINAQLHKPPQQVWILQNFFNTKSEYVFSKRTTLNNFDIFGCYYYMTFQQLLNNVPVSFFTTK